MIFNSINVVSAVSFLEIIHEASAIVEMEFYNFILVNGTVSQDF